MKNFMFFTFIQLIWKIGSSLKAHPLKGSLENRSREASLQSALFVSFVFKSVVPIIRVIQATLSFIRPQEAFPEALKRVDLWYFIIQLVLLGCYSSGKGKQKAVQALKGFIAVCCEEKNMTVPLASTHGTLSISLFIYLLYPSVWQRQ